MPLDAQGYWYPELSPAQLQVYNCYSRYTLVAGPKKSSKTYANLHRLVRHAVETPKGRIGMFTKTIRNAKAGGVWVDLVDLILPEWLDAKQTRFTSRKADGTYGPKQDAQSRMVYVKVANAHGGETEIQLHSIDNEKEVESIAKGTRFSMFYFAELSNFRNRLVFDITSDQLRVPGLAFEDHMWLADTNPADDGEDSWIYELWYKLRMKHNRTPQENQLFKHMALFEIMIEDNPYLSEEEKADLYARFSHDKDLEDRYIHGKWVRASQDALFHQQYSDDLHKLGDNSGRLESDWQIVLPSDHCTTLISGWDLGDNFHSAHIIEPTEAENGRAYYVIDEVVHLDKVNRIGISDFCDMFMASYKVWMKLVTGGDLKLADTFEWRHWSDKAALTNYRSGAETYDKNLVYKYSDGDVVLMGAPKFQGSIGKRINLMRILLHERKLFISAKCVRTIEMLKGLRKGKTMNQLIAPGQLHRHVFDSLTYALSAEEPALLFSELTDEPDSEERGEPVRVRL